MHRTEQHLKSAKNLKGNDICRKKKQKRGSSKNNKKKGKYWRGRVDTEEFTGGGNNAEDAGREDSAGVKIVAEGVQEFEAKDGAGGEGEGRDNWIGC